MDDQSSEKFSIERSQALAAYFVATVGITRLLGVFYLHYFGVPFNSWVEFLPSILLIGISPWIYRGGRWAWAAGFVLCAIFEYFLVSEAVALPWSSLTFDAKLIGSLTLGTLDLVFYMLSMVFLFLMRYKQNRQVTLDRLDLP